MSIDIGLLEYMKIHHWLRNNYGRPEICEAKDCSKKSKTFEWALKKSKSYERNRKNYFRLCKSCHSKYDYTEEIREKMKKNSFYAKKTHCPSGHEYTKENTYKSKARKGRICLICKRLSQKKYKKKRKMLLESWGKRNV